MSSKLDVALGNETDRLALLALKDQLVDVFSWNFNFMECLSTFVTGKVIIWRKLYPMLRISNLKILAIGRNNLSGTIPSSIYNLPSMAYVDMGTNKLSGNLAPEIGFAFPKLEILYIGDNQFTGTIPRSVTNIHGLQQFDIQSNGFSGSVPDNMENLQNLELFTIDYNHLGIGNAGDLDFLSSLSNCSQVKLLAIHENRLGRVLPESVANLSTQLDLLYMGGNRISGSAREGISNLGGISALRILNMLMQGNYFLGSIPLSFGFLRGLENLDLSGNNFSGKIPVDLQKLPFLVSLNLSFNQLGGEVPQKGVFQNVSEFSVIGNKEPCGEIPEIKLPKCFNQEAKKKGNVLSTKVIVIIILGIPLASILGKKSLWLCLLPVGYFRVSYNELLQATNDFASSNCIWGGSFGSVYIGILHRHKNPVAVKVLNLKILGAGKCFAVECEALSKSQHRYLVKLITSYSSIGFKALVLEIVLNGSLDSWLHGHQYGLRYLNFDQSLFIAIDVANALDYLHHHCETLIVHRDLKPTNVLIDDDMVAHVSDFGMAKLLSRAACNNLDSEQATSSVIKGTIGYLGLGLTFMSGGYQAYGGGLQIGEPRSLRFDGSQPIGGIGPRLSTASRGFISIKNSSKAIATNLTIKNKVFIVVDCTTNDGN
ncbi:probable LRR receptor-like serine/threonine-protein kinase At3g47570 [Durio zibethinus]|uniref:Probable LRR receptor-like serine/threonine-protein kinase At3g47570 n=1 Tax=Durio zibethinus TaxID=66656 RepID=A0A6P5Z5J2_DURZI|nr:probable LRR receptor-like serine/threonine-protein kinase At3g47570 [Durio zibethinus]